MVVLPDADLKGKAIDFNLMFTTLRADDGGMIQVPNNLFFQKVVRADLLTFAGVQSTNAKARSSARSARENRERFDQYKFSKHKEEVIDLLRRVTRVSVDTAAIVTELAKASSVKLVDPEQFPELDLLARLLEGELLTITAVGAPA